jgi:nucleotide-binding universal stress UspA family protein
MSKLKVLVPLDGSEKSMHSLDWLKNFFTSEEVEVTLLHVVTVYYVPEMFELKDEEFEANKKASLEILDDAAKRLDGYTVSKMSARGIDANEILRTAKEGSYDMIVMTKSSVKGISRIIGSVTSKVVRDSEIAVVVIPE